MSNLYDVAELCLDVACFSIVVDVCLCTICDKNERLRGFKLSYYNEYKSYLS